MRRSEPGASYADARAVVRRAQSVGTRNGRVDTLADAESEGIGVRVLVNGAWGFACDRRLSAEGARDAALRAAAFAAAAGSRNGRALAPLEARSGTFRPPMERDPFDVSLEDKVALCLRAEEALKHARREGRPGGRPGAPRAEALPLLRGRRDRPGARRVRRRDRRDRGRATGSSRRGATRARTSARARRPAGSTSRSLDLVANAPRVAEEAAALLRADECPPGVTTVVIDAEQMQLQVHESVGHPTELDRVYGTEAAYAGTSFLQPEDLGSLRYGSEHMNITADATTPLGLGTFAFDDEGVPAAREAVVSGGVLTQLPHLPGDGGADRPRRRRVDARRRLAADAARPDDEPPPRAGHGLARGADLRGRRGSLPGDEQELVDRRQAPQLPVRDADGLGDHGTGSSAGCCATRPTPA